MQQLHSPHQRFSHRWTVQPQSSVHSPEDMSNEQLAVWLRNHPQFDWELDYEEDIRKLRGYITAVEYAIIIIT